MSSIEYYFNHLDNNTFQRLINAILIARFGEQIRLTPRFGSDGGKDGETAAFNPYFEFQVENSETLTKGLTAAPQKGRYLFQVKHHRTTDTRLSDVRSIVVQEFDKELKKNVVSRRGQDRVNYFFLITNVPSSEKAIADIDKRQAEIRESNPYLYADVWWGERVESLLDQMPLLWNSFPSLFAGGKAPFLAEIADQKTTGLPRSARIAIDRQYKRDSNIKFRQIDLEKSLQKLFTSLNVNTSNLAVHEIRVILSLHRRDFITQERSNEDFVRIKDSVIAHHYSIEQLSYRREAIIQNTIDEDNALSEGTWFMPSQTPINVLDVLLDEKLSTTRKLILEGGPGQGKSTITQMAIQIYRQQILLKDDLNPEGRWTNPQRSRLPFRIELRLFAEWLSKNIGESVEEYLAYIFKQDSGGAIVTVDDIYNMVEKSPVMLVLDGLDEVGNDDLRNEVLTKIAECINRFEESLSADLRVIITTRPPAVANCQEHLADFKRISIAPMESSKIKEYVKRWLSVQLQDEDDRRDVQDSFEKRQNEPHVQALAKNPMQLSVLLHFIRFKGVAFPDRRAELYREYFRTVIDRDVEKSTSLREQREIIESLHQFLGYKIHALTEAKQADGNLSRQQLLMLVEFWLKSRGSVSKSAHELFKLGEERLGLIVALKGEGEETRYGYEIQPIREYFAAAFINDDIQGNAHEVFQAMIRRSYWKEVSLFLAGLRRPNEKADLIARARALDKDEKLGWRQDGRHLTLQLLQEGVFSEPPHIFSDALDFMFDLLDPRLIKVQSTPKDLIKVLHTLLKQEQNTKRKYVEKLIKLLQEYNSDNDELTISRLYNLASRLLATSDMNNEILSYKGIFPETIAKVRFLWPSSWNVKLHNIVKEPIFWEDVPNSLWSNVIWRTATRYDLSNSLPIPFVFHQLIVEQFAVNGLSIGDILPKFTLNSNLAIWKLVSFYKMFQMVIGYPERSTPSNLVFRTLDENVEINFEGLNKNTKNMIANLLDISRRLLRGFIQDERELLIILEESVSNINMYLHEPGLASWLACRFAIVLVLTTSTKKPRYINQQELESILLSLWKNVKVFFQKYYNSSTDASNEIAEFVSNVIRTSSIAIDFVRIETGEVVSVIDILAQKICDGEEPYFSFINDLPFTRPMLRPLIERCRDHLPVLLAELNSKPFASLVSGPPLLTFDVQRILKIVRNTEKSEILGGALIALSSSKFLRLAGVKLVLKLIQASYRNPQFAMLLFNLNNFDASNAGDREIVDQVASSILESPENFTFTITTAAANYLAERFPVSLPPLLSMEEELKIHIHKRPS